MKFKCLLLMLFATKVYANTNNQARVGISLGGFGIMAVQYDQKIMLNKLPLTEKAKHEFYTNWTLGGEISPLLDGVLISPHAYFWQNSNLSGFYGGPLLIAGIQHSQNTDYFRMGIGGEAGWLYRFKNKLDIGAGVNLGLRSDNSLHSGLKIEIGYVLP